MLVAFGIALEPSKCREVAFLKSDSISISYEIRTKSRKS